MPTGAWILLSLVVVVVSAGALLRAVPVIRHGRLVVLARPRPCSMAEAQDALERLVTAGVDARIVEHDDNGLNVWANVRVAGEVRADERYVVAVPRSQAARAAQV